MELIPSLVQAYADNYTSPLDDLQAGVVAHTESSHDRAHMLSGHNQGKFLSFISKLMRPGRVLEIGSFTGFSALCLAEGLREDGELHTIELREEDARTAQANFNDSIHRDRIILHTGNALDLIPQLDEIWDLVFIDADKTGYLQYYEMVLPRVRSGGWIIADNVLFHGQVLEQPITGKNAKAIAAFNERVRYDERVEHVLLTVRDGLMLIRKR